MKAEHLVARLVSFLCDEDRGSATLWNLFWLLGFCSLLGIGLDTTAAMNTKARLQTVSDAAAQGAVIDIFPVPADAVGSALTYSTLNNSEISGVVTASDVVIGHWDRDTRTFQTGALPEYNAVRVLATRDSSRENALGTFFLRTVGFHNWDINAVSTAFYYDDLSLTDRCRKNGLFAGNHMEQTSNNVITGDYCLHGEGQLKINSNNIVTCGVEISMPSQDAWESSAINLDGVYPEECVEYDGTGNISNDDMVEQALVYRSIRNNAEAEYKYVKKILDAYIDGQAINDPFNAIPPYYHDVTAFNNDAKQPQGRGDYKLVPGTLYVVNACAGTNQKINLEGRIQNIGIYTDCIINVTKHKKTSNIKPTKVVGNYERNNLCDPDAGTCEQVPWDSEFNTQLGCADMIAALQADAITPDSDQFETYQTLSDTIDARTYRDGVTQDTAEELCVIEPGANGVWDNVFIFTSAHENGDVTHEAINLPNNMQIGRMDGCTEGGGARIYAAGSLSTPSGTMVHGSQFVLLGNAKLAAKASGVHGLTIEAAGNITYSAQGRVGGCSADEDDRASDVVITVRSATLVE